VAAPEQRGAAGDEALLRGQALRRLVTGYQVSQALHVAATLGIAELLADGPRTVVELAATTDAHEPSLYRLLRALATVGVLHEGDGRSFALAPLGELLRPDVEGTVHGWAAFVGRPYYWQAWAHLLHSVRTGETGFEHVHGVDVWTYRSTRPEESALFDRAMASLTAGVHHAVLEAHDFGRYRTVVDAGGGNGALLAAILAAHPALHGTLLDQPHVAAGAEAVLGQAGVADRATVVAGSFFDAVPAGDACLLKSIVHDWDDERAVAILRSCRDAVAPEGVVLVVERVLGPPNEDPEAAFSDLNMLVAPGGRERTLAEYETLFAAAGLALAGRTRLVTGHSLLEAAPDGS
jgi:hypothetical protein